MQMELSAEEEKSLFITQEIAFARHLKVLLPVSLVVLEELLPILRAGVDLMCQLCVADARVLLVLHKVCHVEIELLGACERMNINVSKVAKAIGQGVARRFGKIRDRYEKDTDEN